MASLFNTRISDTYSGLIKTIDNAALTSSLKELTDGSGLASGVFMNTAGDFKVTAILEFGSLKDTGENIIISKFVDAADGIGNNDNDTTIPTTAAIIDYVAAQITIEDLDFTGDTGSGQIDLDSQIFAIGGTTNEIKTVASGQSITFSLDSTGVNLPDNSTAITQTAGDNSTKIATTSYVDTLDAASDLDFSGDSGTGDVNLNTQTFAITGTANQIESSASGQGLSLQFPSAGITLPNGSVATTQSAGDNSTKVATTSYVDTLDAASDLDITDGTNTGDVNLNTQSLSILGTTNEIDSVVSGQSVTLGLPNQINVNVQGNLTGNVTGDVTGDLTGNSAGTHTGAVVGNVTGNLTGNVVGDLTGNADTATAWETARDLSLTGQATGTISSVDGTNNVSGAVTLDNNSVIGKVLTGLTSPSASSVLATDTILEGFGKVQSQINGLAGGLRFMGSWDASSNSPVLGSGGGEAAAGTTTGVQASKLIDSTATFTSTVTIGDQVVNQVDGQTALVTNVDSNTTLSLDADIMLSGEAYTIDNSPFITQGHYYVVSVGGSTTLNGISSWTVGDWVIAGANNQWTKLDHSQVDGTGTPGNLTKWSATQVIADSIVSESGSAITVDGSLSTNTNLSSTGNFAVNTNKFTVAAASGNTLVAGTLNTGVITGTSANLTTSGTVLSLDRTGGATALVELKIGGTVEGYLGANSTKSLIVFNESASEKLSVSNGGNLITTGSGTFAGDVTANVGTFNSDSGGTALKLIGRSAANSGTLRYYQNNGTTQTARIESNDSIFEINSISNLPIQLKTNDTLALTIDASQNSTFAGSVNVTSGASLGSGLQVARTGHPSLSIITGGTSNAYIGIAPSGGTYVDAITISDTGNATFAGNVTLSSGFANLPAGTEADPSLIFAGDDDTGLWHPASNTLAFSTFGNERMRIDSSGNVGIGNDDPSYKLSVNSGGANVGIKVVSTDSSATIAFKDDTTTGDNVQCGAVGNDFKVLAGGGTRLKVTSNGNLEILGTNSGATNNQMKLIFDNSDVTVQNNQLMGGIEFKSADGSGQGAGIKSSINTIFTGTGGYNDMVFSTAGTDANNAERMRITSSGVVSITNSFNGINAYVENDTHNAVFQIKASATGKNSEIWFGDSADSNVGKIDYDHNDNSMSFTTNATERMRIDSSGRVGIGGIVPSQQLELGGILSPALKLSSTTTNGGVIIFNVAGADKGFIGSGYHLGTGSSNDTAMRGEADLVFLSGGNNQRMRITSGGDVGIGVTTPYTGGTAGRRVLDVGGTTQALLAFSVGGAAQSYFFQDGTDFKMTNLAAAGGDIIIENNGAERMRITSEGYILLGTEGLPDGTSVYGSAFIPSSVNRTVLSQASSSTASSVLQVYRNPNGIVGSISMTNSTTAYNTTSDYRLKEDLQDFAGLDMVSKIPVYDFKWKLDESRSYGVMAHELQEVLPDAVSGEKDAEEMQGVDYSKIVPLLVKSIQELKAEVDKLKQECKCKN
jgi:hypothetical protein